MGKLLAAAAICCIVAIVCLAQLTEATKGYVEKPKKIQFVHVPKPIFVKVEKKVPVVKYKPIFIPKPIIVKKIEKVPVIKKVHIIKEVKVPVIKKVPYPVEVKKIKVSSRSPFYPLGFLQKTNQLFRLNSVRQGASFHEGEEAQRQGLQHGILLNSVVSSNQSK